MRKLWYAGAALAGGVFLFAATPAQADLLPGADTAAQQTDERLADLLGQSNGLDVANPLGSSSLKDTALGKTPVAQFKGGQNSPDLNPVLPGEGDAPRRGLMPRESAGDERPQTQPDADVVRGSSRSLPVRSLPIFGSDGLPTLNGVMADGQTQNFWFPVMQNSSLTGRPLDATSFGQFRQARPAEGFDGGLPLLGGLGGVLPVNETPRTLPATDEPDISGMPGGGVAIMPAATPSTPASPAQAKPAKPAKPQKQKPAPQPTPTATPDDPRLHEEPVDNDDTATEGDAAQAEHRPFSADGRPVAGIDQQYK